MDEAAPIHDCHHSVLTGHCGAVNCLQLTEKRDLWPWLISGGTDNYVRIWDITKTPHVCLYVLSGHERPVTLAMYEVTSADGGVGPFIITSSWDYKLRTFNLGNNAKTRIVSSPLLLK